MVKYQKLAKEANEYHRVFIGSMMDIFEKPMPLIDSKGNQITGMDSGDIRDTLFHLINKNNFPNLIFLFLTKRPSNINKYIPTEWQVEPPTNVMFGTSIVDQLTADRYVEMLLKVKGHKFLSCEPQLDHIEFNPYWLIGDPAHKGQIDWVIQSGESGHGRRPFNLDWAYSMKEQCAKYNTPYFFKQIDKIKPIPEDLMIRQFADLRLFQR